MLCPVYNMQITLFKYHIARTMLCDTATSYLHIIQIDLANIGPTPLFYFTRGGAIAVSQLLVFVVNSLWFCVTLTLPGSKAVDS